MAAIETGLRQAEALNTKMNDLRERLEKHINLNQYTDNHKNVTPKGNAKLMRICLIAGLSDNEKRKKEVLNIQMSSNSIQPTLFTVHNLNGMLSSMLKLRYHDLEINWEDNITKSKVVNAEIFRGFDILMKGDTLHEWLKVSTTASIKAGQIPLLNLNIGNYDGDINAYLGSAEKLQSV